MNKVLGSIKKRPTFAEGEGAYLGIRTFVESIEVATDTRLSSHARHRQHRSLTTRSRQRYP